MNTHSERIPRLSRRGQRANKNGPFSTRVEEPLFVKAGLFNTFNQRWAGIFAVILLAAVLVPGLALAGTADTEFQPLYQKFLDWVGGYLGKTLAVGALIGGLFIGIIRQSPLPAIAGIAAAVFAAYGPIVIEGLIGATF